MSESFDQNQQDTERLDNCPCCEGNFLNYQPQKPIQRYDEEWMLALVCNACGFEEDMAASDEGLQAFNTQIAETSLSMLTESYQIKNMSVSTLMNELEKSGILPPLEPRA